VVQEPDDWTIRPGRDDDVEAVVGLLRTCLGAGGVPRSAEFWRWKHQHNPFGPSPVLVAAAGEQIVAVRAFMRWRWHSGDREVSAVRAVDTATHPGWRGRGLFSLLTRRLAAQMADDGVGFVFNTPNRKSGAGYRKMGWRPVGRLPVYGRRLAPASRAAAALRPVRELLEQPETEGLLAAVDHRRRSDPRLRTAATLPYLSWRYGGAPGLDYRAAWDGGGDAAAAVVVRTRRRHGLLEASVSEILAASAAGADTAAQLLRGLGAATGAHYALAVATPGTGEHAALRRAGFLRLPAAGPRLLARLLSPPGGLPDVHDLDAWRLATGSFELF
jgi:GNAT superfamily N-acetyltransferase